MTLRFFYHPESDSLFTGEEHPGGDLVEEIDEAQFLVIQGRQEDEQSLQLCDRIRHLHKHGRLRSFSIKQVGERYQANMLVEGSTFTHWISADPMESLMRAIGAMPGAGVTDRPHDPAPAPEAKPKPQDDFGDLLG